MPQHSDAMLMRSQNKAPSLVVSETSAPESPSVAARSAPKYLLDTSVIIDLPKLDLSPYVGDWAICALTLAELAAGPNATADPIERTLRQDRLQRVEATFEPVPFGTEAARAYLRIDAAVRATGRLPRRRIADLLIASVALADDFTLITRNPDDFAGLETLLSIVHV